MGNPWEGVKQRDLNRHGWRIIMCSLDCLRGLGAAVSY